MKKVWILLGCIVAMTAIVAGVVAGVLVGTAKKQVIGTWAAEIGYLESYHCEIIVEYEFMEDGTFSQAFRSVETGGIQNMKYGTWSMSGLELHCRREANGGNTPFRFRPLSGVLVNGTVTYEKIN